MYYLNYSSFFQFVIIIDLTVRKMHAMTNLPYCIFFYLFHEYLIEISLVSYYIPEHVFICFLDPYIITSTTEWPTTTEPVETSINGVNGILYYNTFWISSSESLTSLSLVHVSTFSTGISVDPSTFVVYISSGMSLTEDM